MAVFSLASYRLKLRFFFYFVLEPSSFLVYFLRVLFPPEQKYPSTCLLFCRFHHLAALDIFTSLRSNRFLALCSVGCSFQPLHQMALYPTHWTSQTDLWPFAFLAFQRLNMCPCHVFMYVFLNWLRYVTKMFIVSCTLSHFFGL